MEQNPNQFTMRRLLFATFWMGVWFAILGLFNSNSRLPDILMMPAFVIACGGPFIAIGALVGRTGKGFFAAFCAAIAVIVLLVFFGPKIY